MGEKNMKKQIMIVCALLAVAGCSRYKGGTDSESETGSGSGARVGTPSSNSDTNFYRTPSTNGTNQVTSPSSTNGTLQGTSPQTEGTQKPQNGSPTPPNAANPHN